MVVMVVVILVVLVVMKERLDALVLSLTHHSTVPILLIVVTDAGTLSGELQRHSKLSTRFPQNVDSITQPLGAFFSVNPLFFHWSKAKKMEVEKGLARVSWYERLLLIGPNHFFHRLLKKGRESSER